MSFTLTPPTLTTLATKIKRQHKVVANMLSNSDALMARRRLLLLLKPFDAYPPHHSFGFTNPKIQRHLDDRMRVHKDAIKFCQDVLQRKMVVLETLFLKDLSSPIQDVDFVITVGGDGTLLQASHFMDDTIPVLGVNSDPTRLEEVEQFNDEFDASRSAGYLCAATVKNFEQVLDDILDKCAAPCEIARISTQVNSKLLSTHALNDLLIAHPCPASVSRLSFRLQNDGHINSSLVNCRSSGLRVSTAAGSSAAMLSAGGFPMHILSKELQYMVREPILQKAGDSSHMHGFVKSSQTMEITWSSEEGGVYIDGCHIVQRLKHGDIIKLSTQAPVLKIFLHPRLLSADGPAKL